MENYVPPFSITNSMLELVSEISEKIGKINSHNALENKPHLRRNNRIRSIHASLKIEANSLSLSEVRDVINGKPVLGDQKEIQEVKNAYEAYRYVPEINPASITELKKIHGIMTRNIVAESGTFRKGEDGVLMRDLLAWVKKSQGSVHPLILSAVFHHEFVIIHPFSDGNGRMARLWHTVILYRWRNIFEYIPLESQIERYQEEYYAAIAKCHANGNSSIFIEFMLNMINRILDDVTAQLGKANANTSEYVRRMLDVMEYDVPYTSHAIMDLLGLKSKETLRKNYINPAIELGVLEMTLPDKPNSKNQRYVKQ